MAIIYDPLLGRLTTSSGTGGSLVPGPAQRYVQNFNATSDWTLNGSFYEIVIAAGTHGKGVNPNVLIFELDTGILTQVTTDSCSFDSSGNVTFQVLLSPDLRFAGRVVII